MRTIELTEKECRYLNRLLSSWLGLSSKWTPKPLARFRLYEVKHKLEWAKKHGVLRG